MTDLVIKEAQDEKNRPMLSICVIVRETKGRSVHRWFFLAS